jgi:hypothetical protein
VRAEVLDSRDRDILSQPFELNVGGLVSFKLGLYPKAAANGDSLSFKRAKGKGVVMLRCTDSVRTQTKVQFRIAVDSAPSENPLHSDPVIHDFFEKPIAYLPAGLDEWNFKTKVHTSTDSFSVCLDILTASD